MAKETQHSGRIAADSQGTSHLRVTLEKAFGTSHLAAALQAAQAGSTASTVKPAASTAKPSELKK